MTLTRALVPVLTRKHTYIHMGTLEHYYTRTSNFTLHCFLLSCTFKVPCECVFVTVCHVSGYPWSPEEGVKSHGAGVIGSCELPYVSAGNQTWVLWKKNSKCSQLLSHLFSPDLCVLIHLLSAINCLGRFN